MSLLSRLFFAVAAIAAGVSVWIAWANSCPDLPRLRNSVVVITGCSSGIGAELAVQYAALGANLVIAARRQAQLEETAAHARARGARVLAIPTDMAVHADVDALIAAAVREYGRIDLLVLNHAAVDDSLVLEYANVSSLAAASATVLNSNVLGAISATRAALPHLVASSGHIAVVSSASTIAPSPFHSVYVASKRALHGFFETLQHELHLVDARGVTIGIQILGMIGTDAIMKDPGNHRLAISVPECAAAMICGAQARWREFFVPYWYAPMAAFLSAIGPTAAEWMINYSYIFNVADYVIRIAKLKVELTAAADAAV